MIDTPTVEFRYSPETGEPAKLVVICRHGLDIPTCAYCNSETICPVCNGRINAPSDWRRKHKRCACTPLAVVDGDGRTVGIIALFVPPIEQHPRNLVDSNQFAHYLTDTGQTDLGSELAFESAPDPDDGHDRFGELMRAAYPLYMENIPLDSPWAIWLRDGIPWGALVGNDFIEWAGMQPYELNDNEWHDDERDPDAPEWLSMEHTRQATWFNRLARQAPYYPIGCGKGAIRYWRTERTTALKSDDLNLR